MTEGAGRSFGLGVEAYQGFRPEPPNTIFDEVFRAVDPERQHAVDLGAGSGHATKQLLLRFERVTAVEVDPVMAATIASLGDNLEIVVASAEDVIFPEASVDLVICAMSFHWMDRELVANKISQWLRPGGVFAIYGYGRRSFPAAPLLDAMISGEQQKYWSAFLADGMRRKKNNEILDRVPEFYRRSMNISNEVSVTLDYLIGHLATVSIAAAYARSTGDAHEYWSGFRDQIAALDTKWPTVMSFSREVILAQKRA